MYGTDERLCNGPIRLSVIGCSSTASCRSNWDCGGEMLSKEYLDTARTILRAAQTMTDRHVAGKLRALAEDYERRAEKAAHADAAKALAPSAARESEPLSSTSSSGSLTACGTSSSGLVRSVRHSWRHRTARWSLHTPTASTRAPRSSNAT